MKAIKTITLFCAILGTLAVFVSVLVFTDRRDKFEADRYLDKLRFERIGVYLDIHKQ